MEYTTEMYHSAMSIMANRAEQLGISEDELYHHGILGQKWGIRRYQNEDGSLTPAGRKRYITGDMVVDEQGASHLVGDADARRRDLEEQNERDASKLLNSNKAYNIGNAIGLGGTMLTAGLGLIGAKGITDPGLTAIGMAGGALTAGLGFGIGKYVGKKQTGLDDLPKWIANNTSKYKVNTDDLGSDIRWLDVQQLAKLRNKQYYADM